MNFKKNRLHYRNLPSLKIYIYMDIFGVAILQKIDFRLQYCVFWQEKVN